MLCTSPLLFEQPVCTPVPLGMTCRRIAHQQRCGGAMLIKRCCQKTFDATRFTDLVQLDRERAIKVEEFELACMERSHSFQWIARKTQLQNIFVAARQHVDVSTPGAGRALEPIRIETRAGHILTGSSDPKPRWHRTHLSPVCIRHGHNHSRRLPDVGFSRFHSMSHSSRYLRRPDRCTLDAHTSLVRVQRPVGFHQSSFRQRSSVQFLLVFRSAISAWI
jgi:hypothetical protein